MTVNPGLIRAIGRWSLAGLLLNGVIGSGIYRLPAEVGGKLGGQAWIAWIVAGLAIATIVACYAEVSSRFGEAGGQYLYARLAFGSYAGLQMGWISYLVRLTSAAVNVNLFAVYLAEFIPAAGRGIMPAVVAALYFGLVAWVNVCGVRQATALSDVFILAKLVPLAAFGVWGAWLVFSHGPVAPGPIPAVSGTTWIEAVMLLIYAYGGFESSLVPLSEARQPERDAPFALFVGLGTCMLLFVMVQAVTTWSLPDPGAHPRPIADAARALAGPIGATVMALGALTSLLGWGLAAMVHVPRLTYAMAERGDLPAVFGRVHPVYRTPAVSIIVYAVISFALTLSGTLLQNLSIAVIARLVTYAIVCLSLPALRRRDGRDAALPAARFRLPGGWLFPALGVGISVVLATRLGLRDVAIMAIVIFLGTGHWLVNRRLTVAR